MKAMLLNRIVSDIHENREPLELTELPIPEPSGNELLISISRCGVCHTEIDEIEGRIRARLPIILGHEVIGRVKLLGPDARKFEVNERVGISWINWACGQCEFCLSGRENLCPNAKFTGKDVNGGYAEYALISEDFSIRIPERFTDSRAAPLLCAGAIGYRALRLSGVKPGQTLGLFGFGASAHIVIQIAKYFGNQVFVFTGSETHKSLAEDLRAEWVGDYDDLPPDLLDCAIDFTPAGEMIPKALRVLKSGGRLVVNVIRKRTSIELDYAQHLWHEKELKSVANITRRDVGDLLSLAVKIPIFPEVQEFKLEDANMALGLLKGRKIQGAAVLRIQ